MLASSTKNLAGECYIHFYTYINRAIELYNNFQTWAFQENKNLSSSSRVNFKRKSKHLLHNKLHVTIKVIEVASICILFQITIIQNKRSPSKRLLFQFN